jgi:hypothetical protein
MASYFLQNHPDAREDFYFVLTSLAHVVATILFGMLLNLHQFPGPLIIAFAVTSKAFALFAGENERFFAHLRWAALPLAALSLVFLAFLPPLDWVLGGAVMLLYVNYPRLLKAREKSPLDVLFHGSRYAILFWLGYGGAPTATSEVGLAVVFLFGVSGELLVGLRSNANWKTTASIIGITSTVRLVNALAFTLILLASFIVSQVIDFPLMVGEIAIPIPLIFGLGIAIFITRPVSRGRSWSAPLSVRRREVIVIAFIALLLIGVPLATRVNLSEAVPTANYRVDVTMQTFATGPHSWEGQWIIFDYQNSRNYYYVFLHTDGSLELSRYVNGTAQTHLAYVQTSLSPFNRQQYQITVDNGTIQISLDGRQYVSAPLGRQSIGSPLGQLGGQVKISQSFPHQNFWVVSVSELSVSSVRS